LIWRNFYEWLDEKINTSRFDYQKNIGRRDR